MKLKKFILLSSKYHYNKSANAARVLPVLAYFFLIRHDLLRCTMLYLDVSSCTVPCLHSLWRWCIASSLLASAELPSPTSISWASCCHCPTIFRQGRGESKLPDACDTTTYSKVACSETRWAVRSVAAIEAMTSGGSRCFKSPSRLISTSRTSGKLD